MASSVKEMDYAKFADYVIVNDDFNYALDALKGIIIFNHVMDSDLTCWEKTNNLNKPHCLKVLSDTITTLIKGRVMVKSQLKTVSKIWIRI